MKLLSIQLKNIEWILFRNFVFDLGPIPVISHYVYTNISKSEKIKNPEVQNMSGLKVFG
jgi:hypothetical protein